LCHNAIARQVAEEIALCISTLNNNYPYANTTIKQEHKELVLHVSHSWANSLLVLSIPISTVYGHWGENGNV
jgi:hypothetical protein